MTARTSHIARRLQSEILNLQGFKPSNNGVIDLDLGEIANAFPNKSFPLGAVHEFIATGQESTASTIGFINGLISPLIDNGKVVLWVGTSRSIYPSALPYFRVQPHQFIFIHLKKQEDVLWTINEALKCSALALVIGELDDLSFTMSRRFQLAVEQSKVTGFILRKRNHKVSTTACVSRWRITSLPSEISNGLPGVGLPSWKVELLRVRNGEPGCWNIYWKNGHFVSLNGSQQENGQNLFLRTGSD
jgi:protein ImuA